MSLTKLQIRIRDKVFPLIAWIVIRQSLSMTTLLNCMLQSLSNYKVSATRIGRSPIMFAFLVMALPVVLLQTKLMVVLLFILFFEASVLLMNNSFTCINSIRTSTISINSSLVYHSSSQIKNKHRITFVAFKDNLISMSSYSLGDNNSLF